MAVPNLIMTRLPYRGFASRIFLPYEGQLAQMGTKMPFAFLLFDSASMVPGGVVLPQDTQTGYVSQPEGCYLTHLVGTGTPAEEGGTLPFAVQIYDAQRQKLWTPQPITFSSILGTAGTPFWLKKLYHMPATGQLQCQVSNISTSPNAIQVVAWGVCD